MSLLPVTRLSPSKPSKLYYAVWSTRPARIARTTPSKARVARHPGAEMGSRTGTLQLVCLPMNSVAMCAPRGRGRCPMTVARSLQIPEDPTRIRRWRAGAKTSLHRCGWLVSQSGGNNRKSVMCEPSTLYRAVWPRPTSVFVQCRPGLHGPRCARLTSILGLSGAVEHTGGASHVSIADLGRSPFRALGLAMRAPERSALRPIRVPVDEAQSPPT